MHKPEERFSLMIYLKRVVGCALLSVCTTLWLCCCAGVTAFGKLSYAQSKVDPLALYSLTGDTSPVLDPSIMRQGATYYAFSTDVVGFASSGSLPIHCS
jgi:hypothetical protein